MIFFVKRFSRRICSVVSDVPDEVKANMEIIGVASAFDVIPLALEHTPQKTADAFIPQHAHSGAAAAQ